MTTTPTLRHRFLAEMLGTFLLVLFGCGAVHSKVVGGALTGLWQVGIVWGLAIMLAIYTVGPISGAHINPAITVGLATSGLFPWRHVPAYVAAQFLGAFIAAAVLFGMWNPMLREKEASQAVAGDDAAQTIVRGQPGSEITAMCYGEYFPNPGLLFADGAPPYSPERHAEFNRRVPHLTAFLAEVLGTAILALVVCAVTNAAATMGPKNLAPAFIGLTVAGLICIIDPLTQACFNPARDLGPRVFAAVAGWGKVALPGVNGVGFFTVYIFAPLLGGIAGVGLYQRWIGPTIAGSRELPRTDEDATSSDRDRDARPEHVAR